MSDAELADFAGRFGWDGKRPLNEWLRDCIVDRKVTRETHEEMKRTFCAHTHFFYSTRMSEMDAWMRKNAPEDVKQQYFCIVANGCPGIAAPQMAAKERPMYEALLIKADQLAREKAEEWSGFTEEIATVQKSAEALARDYSLPPSVRGQIHKIATVLSLMTPNQRPEEE